MTFLTLKIRSRSWCLNLVFALPWWFCVPHLVRIHQIFLQILRGKPSCIWRHLKSPLLPWKSGQGHLVQTWSLTCPANSVCQICWGYIKYFFRYWAKTILNDYRWSCGLENEVKVTRFKLNLHFAWMPLFTTFDEASSNISSDIERKPF